MSGFLRFCGAFVFLSFIYGCNSGEKVPDVSGIKLSLQTSRFDKDLYAIDTNHVGEGLQQLKNKYPDFLNFYLDTLIGFGVNGNYNDTAHGVRLGVRAFLTNKNYRSVYDTAMVDFPDTKNIDAELAKGFQFVKYYFPDYKVPHVIYVVSGLNNWAAFTYGGNILGIGLDMYFGDAYPFYKYVDIPAYMAPHLRPSYIPVAAFTAIYEDSHPIMVDDKDLLDLMIQKGKEQYFLHKVLPHTPDSVLFAFNQAQVQWCNHNAGSIYNFFIHENLFYSKERQTIMRYITDGPYATGMPGDKKEDAGKASPGNVGTWLGYEMVKSYMAQHPKTSLKQLLALQVSGESFLEQSKYKPK